MVVTELLPWAACSMLDNPFGGDIFALISNLNLPWHNLRMFSDLLSLVTWEKGSTPSCPQPPFQWLQGAIEFPLSLLLSRSWKPVPAVHPQNYIFTLPFISAIL